MQVKDLIVTGDAKILGNLYANGGSVSGGSGGGSSDGSGLTYTLTKSGSTITLAGSDGSTSSVTDSNTDTNTTYSVATTSAAGLMSAADKVKLDSLTADGAKVEVGSYVGTGSYGVNNPNILTFNLQPKIVIIQADSDYEANPTGIMIRGQSQMASVGNVSSSSSAMMCQLNWFDASGKYSVNWYTTNSHSKYQLNVANKKYWYCAIG